MDMNFVLQMAKKYSKSHYYCTQHNVALFIYFWFIFAFVHFCSLQSLQTITAVFFCRVANSVGKQILHGLERVQFTLKRIILQLHYRNSCCKEKPVIPIKLQQVALEGGLTRAMRQMRGSRKPK